MTPQELKNSILQLAIQGKLVEQRPEEGTAEELFARIQEEKQRLIAEKKIKKEKLLPEIEEEEKPFDIPESWKWVRLGEVFQHNTGKALNSANRVGVSLKYITTSNLYWNRFELENLKEMFFTDAELEKCTVQRGDLLVCEGGDIGRAAIWKSNDNIRIQNHIHRLRSYCTVCTEFFYYLFYLYKHAGWIGGKGIGIQGLSSKAIHVLVFPLPPLAEQKRIVAKIEELLPYIDRYEQAWCKLEKFNSRFPEDMKKSLLQYAIQGKLVEQRPEEGTAEEFFEQIQEEKQRLIAEKKIKKEKSLPDITDDERPFDIPESWKWVRLGALVLFENGDRSNKYPVGTDYVNFGIPFFGAKDMGDKFMLFDNVRYISECKFNELGNGKLQDQDFICLLRGSVGKVAIFEKDSKHKTGFICAQMVILRCINLKVVQYLYYLMKSTYYVKSVESKTTGTAVRQLPAKELANILIPLPPLAEQKRIVQKLEQLLSLCEQLR